MKTLLRVFIIGNIILSILLFWIYSLGSEGMFFATGLIIWICGPLYLVGLISSIVRYKIVKNDTDLTLAALNSIGFGIIVVFSTRF